MPKGSEGSSREGRAHGTGGGRSPTEPHFLLVAAALLLVVLLVYANSLGGAFILDDNEFFGGSEVLETPRNIPDFFTKDLWNVSGKLRLYRPLTLTVISLDRFFWGRNPSGYHITNVLLHGLCSLFLFALFRKLLRDPKASLLGALLFAVHPIHTEAVSWISGRTELLCALFFLLAWTLYLYAGPPSKGGTRAARYAFSLLAFWLALLSKENAVLLPFVLLLSDLFFGGRSARPGRRLLPALPFFLLLAFYLLVRGNVLGGSGYASGFAFPPFAERLLLAPRIFLKGMTLLLFPVGLRLDYGDAALLQSAPPPALLLSAAALLLLVVCALVGATRRRALSFAALLFALTFLPFCGLVPTHEVFVERMLYIPSVALSFAAGLTLVSMRPLRSRRMLPSLSMAALAFLAVLTLARNRDWKNEVAIWRSAAEREPSSSAIQSNLGVALMRMGRFEEALPLFHRAFQGGEKDAGICLYLGICHKRTGRGERALQAFGRAVALDPAHALAQSLYGEALLEAGDNAGAEKALRESIRRRPEDPKSRLLLARALHRGGKSKEAARECIAALRYKEMPEAYLEIGRIYHSMGLYPLAIRYLNTAPAFAASKSESLLLLSESHKKSGSYRLAKNALLELIALEPSENLHRERLTALCSLYDGLFPEPSDRTPRLARYHNELGLLFMNRRQPNQAAEEFSRALESQPEYLDAMHNLGLAYAVAERMDRAREQFEKVLERDPDSTDALISLGTCCAEKGDYEGARKRWERVLEIDPAHPKALRNLNRLKEKERAFTPTK